MRRLHRSLLVVIAVAAASAFSAAHAQGAQERIAWVRMATGTVKVRPEGNPPKPFEPLTQIDQSLFNGDTIRTGGDGRAVIQFTDGSRLYCFEEAEFIITEGERARSVLGFEAKRYTSRLIGVVRGAIGLAVEPNDELSTEVQSPTTVIGVRGTIIDPFQVDPTTSETLVGLKRGRAWGYTPDGQAAFELSPGLLARLGRDALGRPTVRSEMGLLGLITRDHKVRLQQGQGVFLDLKTAWGRAVIGAVPRSVGRVVVEAGGNRALLEARQSLKTLVDRKAGRLSIEALQGKVSITDELGKKRLLAPGRPAEFKFTPPAFEPQVIPGPKPRPGQPKGRPISGIPEVRGKGTLAPALKPRGTRKPPGFKAPGTSGGVKIPGARIPPLPKLPEIKGKAIPPALTTPPRLPKAPARGPGTSPSPLKRLLEKAMPPRSPPAPTPVQPKPEGSKLPPLKQMPTSKAPFAKPPEGARPAAQEPSAKPRLAPKRRRLLRNPLRKFRR